ncbi:hypothetical protein [Saltatorellus ferox]|uniref:hypothetical protein n=1 Tax=Saltatorellus ferox TaxID=2528018 RepID=UPI003AF33277
MIRIFAIAAALYVVLRLAYVLAMGDVFFYGEELEKGAVAKMLLDGVEIPYARMPFHPYEGGGFVASHLKALMFLLVGQNILAHKLAAIAWGLGTVFASVGLAWRFAGAGAAMLAGFLMAFGPAHFQKQSLLHLGIHYEALLFMGFVFWLGLEVARTPRDRRPDRLTLFGLGLASGFGTYFSYQVPIAVLSVIVLLAATNWRRIFAWPLVVGTLVGLAPLMLMYASVGREILDIHGSEVGGGGGWERLVGAIRVGLADVQRLPTFTILSAGLAIVSGLSFARPRDDRAWALALFGGFALLWLAFAGASGMIEPVAEGAHWVRFIRFAPLVWALLMIVALSAGPAVSAKGEARSTPPAKMARIGVTLLVALGAVHAAQIIDGGSLRRAGDHWQTLTSVHGYELRGAFVKVVPRLARENDSPEGYAKAVAPLFSIRVPKRQDAGVGEGAPDFLAAEITAAVGHAAPGFGSAAMGEALRQVAGDGATGVALGLGAAVFREASGNVRGALERADLDASAAEALGRYGTGFLSWEPYVKGELDAARETPGQIPFLRGLGRRIFRSSVMQLYWGPDTRLDPVALRDRLVEGAPALGAGPAELAALLEGVRSAAWDYGFPDAVAVRLVP